MLIETFVTPHTWTVDVHIYQVQERFYYLDGTSWLLWTEMERIHAQLNVGLWSTSQGRDCSDVCLQDGCFCR